MAALLTVTDLSVWTRTTITSDDEFALAVVDGASLLVAETAGHPEWTIGTVPPRAKLIAILLAKRTYLNPDAISASNVGPIGERVVEDFARTMELTEAEIEALQALQGDGTGPDSGLWIQPTSRGPLETPLYLYTEGDWAIPYLDPDKDPYYWPMVEDAV